MMIEIIIETKLKISIYLYSDTTSSITLVMSVIDEKLCIGCGVYELMLSPCRTTYWNNNSKGKKISMKMATNLLVY